MKSVTENITPVEKLMSYYTPQTQSAPQDNSNWGRFKRFSGSPMGRTVWGGLGSALAVALSGGNFKDALSYGVIGAGNTVNALNQNKQYENSLKLQQQQRMDALAKEQRDNQFRLKLQDRALSQSKMLADYQLDNPLKQLRGENKIKEDAEQAARQRKITAINGNPYLTEDQKQWQIAGLDGVNFNRNAYYSDILARNPNNTEALGYFANQAKVNNLINPVNYTETVLKNADKFTPESFGNFSRSGDISQLIPNKKYASGDLGLIQRMVEEGTPFAEALDRVGKMTPEEKIVFEGKKAGAIKGAEQPYVLEAQNNQANNNLNNSITMAGVDYGYQTKGAYRDAEIEKDQKLLDERLKRGFETFKTTLPAANIIEANQTAQALQAQGYNVTVGDILFNDYKKGVLVNENTAAAINKTVADTNKTNQELSNLQNPNYGTNKELAKQRAKDIDEYQNMISKLPQLEETVLRLGELADKATYTYAGQSVDWLNKQLFGGTTEGASARAEYESIVNNQILPLLRDTFGAQFTEREGEQLRKTLGDLNATPAQKKNLLNAFINQKISDIESKKRKIESYGFDYNISGNQVNTDGFVIERVE